MAPAALESPPGVGLPVVLVRQGPLMDLEQCLRRGLAGSAELVFRAAYRDIRLPVPSVVDAAVLDIASATERADGSPVFGELELMRHAGQVPEVICVLPRQEVPALIDSVERSGADFVVRPFEPEELILRVRRAVRRSRVRGRRDGGPAESPAESVAAGEDHDEVGLSRMRFREAMQRAHDRAARAYLTELLKQVDGEVARAARQAGLERESLHRLLKKHEIRAGDFRSSRAGRDPPW